MLHGLGGAKENYYEACKSDALAGHRLISMDNPGTGNSTYYEDMPLNIDDLVEIIALFIAQLELKDFVLILLMNYQVHCHVLDLHHQR